MPAAAHARFAAAVRRRSGVAAAAARVAVVASVAVTAAVVAGRWLAAPSAAWAVVGIATVGFIARTARRWPTLSSAAAAADDQFGWDDLLSTAVATGRSADPFAAAVRAAADDRCRSRLPSTVHLPPRVGRTWVAAAVAVAAVACALPRPTRPRPAATPADDYAVLAADPVPPPSVAAAAIDRPRPTVDPSDDRPMPADTDAAPPPAATAGQRPTSPTDRRGLAAGVGRGASATAARVPAPPVDAPRDTAGRADPDAAVAGGGASVGHAQPGSDAAAGTVASTAALPRRPAALGVAASAGGSSPVRLDDVPAVDRRLVRDFFATDAR